MTAYETFLDFCEKKGLRCVERGDVGKAEIFIAETDKEADLLRFPQYPNGGCNRPGPGYRLRVKWTYVLLLNWIP